MDKLPDITLKQEAFCLGLLCGMTASDAYRDAYDTENMATKTIWEAACRLHGHSKVVARLDRARQAAAEKEGLTAEAHARELKRLATLALAGKNYGAAMRGEELRGRVAGHYVDRIRNETPDPVQDARSALLAHVDKISPEAGKLLRQAMLQAPQKAVRGH